MKLITITRKSGKIKIEIPASSTPQEIAEILKEHEINPNEKYTIEAWPKQNKPSEI